MSVRKNTGGYLFKVELYLNFWDFEKTAFWIDSAVRTLIQVPKDLFQVFTVVLVDHQIGDPRENQGNFGNSIKNFSVVI